MTPFSMQHAGLGFGRYRDATPRALLFHGNGADGSTVFNDSGNNHLAATRFGGPEIKSDGAAFGGASMSYYQGASSYIEYTAPSQLFSGTTWTIECIVELVALPTTNNAGTNYNTIVGLRNGATRRAVFGAGNANFRLFGATVGATSTGARFYLAVSGNASGVSYYINGSRVTTSAAINNAGYDTVAIGCIDEVINNSDWSHSGKVEEVRLTDGIALYTGTSYTLQTEAFQDP